MSPETRIGDGSAAAAEPSSAESPVRLAEQYLSRWRILVGEVERFREALRDDLGPQDAARLGPYVTRLRTEMAGAQAVLERATAFDQQHPVSERPVGGQHGGASEERDAAEKQLRMQLAASNVSSQELQWNIVKKCRSVLSIQRYFRLKAAPGQRKQKQGGPSDDVVVSAVVQNGSEWVRIVLAANGWDFGGGSDGEDGEDGGDSSNEADTSDISVLRIAADLLEASRTHRLEHNYATPKVRMVFVWIDEGACRDVDVLFSRVRKLGITVDAANSPFCTSEAPSIETAIPRLLPSTLMDLTPVVNIDTSILVALG